MLTEKEAFKTGFLIRCAQEGLSDEEVSSRVGVGSEKMAVLDKVGQDPGAAATALRFSWDALKTPLKLVPWAIGLGALGGVGLGTMSAGIRNQMDPDYGPGMVPEEIQDVHAAEIAQTLRTEASKARRRAARIRRKREEAAAAERTRYRF
jgi:hypothetical protein